LNWYFEVLRKYAAFEGRAPRIEYWTFALVNLVVVLVLLFGETAAGGPGVLFWIYVLAILLPSISVSVRRLHDTNRSGWWLLLSFVPLGSLVLLVFYTLDSTPGTNDFGPNPKDRTRPILAESPMDAERNPSIAAKNQEMDRPDHLTEAKATETPLVEYKRPVQEDFRATEQHPPASARSLNPVPLRTVVDPVCQSCGRINRGGEQTCVDCSQALTLRCANCKHRVQGDDKFCGSCGHGLFSELQKGTQ
jgi:uncharacterized membrane protein YhaH (DUF805 family)